jgi:hypothetical protein
MNMLGSHPKEEDYNILKDVRSLATVALAAGLLSMPQTSNADGTIIYTPPSGGSGSVSPGMSNGMPYPYYYNHPSQPQAPLALPHFEPLDPTIHFNLPQNNIPREFSVDALPSVINFRSVGSETWLNARLPNRPEASYRYLTLSNSSHFNEPPTYYKPDISPEDLAQNVGQAFKNMLSEPIINYKLRELGNFTAKLLLDNPSQGVLIRVSKYIDEIGDSVVLPNGIYIEGIGSGPGEAFVQAQKAAERYGTIGEEKPSLFLSPDTYWIWATLDPTNLDSGIRTESIDWIEMEFGAGCYLKFGAEK